MLVNNTRTDYNSDDSTELIYAIGFAYSTPSEVQVRTTDEDGLFYRIYNWEFLGSDQIRFTSTPPATFEIYRETDLSRGYGVSKYNVFNSGSVISANDLNGNFELLRSAIEENQNLLSDLLFEGGEGVYDDRYILRNGDTGIGDLSFGTDGSITLDSNNGSATFAGNVIINDGISDRISLGKNGLVQVFRNSNNATNGLLRLYSNVNENRGEVVYVGADGKINIGGTPDTAPNTSLQADGSASFAGVTNHGGGVKVTGGTLDGVVDGINRATNGSVNFIQGSQTVIQLNSGTNYKLSIQPKLDGGSGTIGYGCVLSPKITNSEFTSTHVFRSQPDLEGLTASDVNYFSATYLTSNEKPTAVDNVYGFRVTPSVNFGTVQNYGFYSDLAASGSKDYNFYAAGTAPNYFAGNVGIGTETPEAKLEVTDTANDSPGPSLLLRSTGNLNANVASIQKLAGSANNRSLVIHSSRGSNPNPFIFNTGILDTGEDIEVMRITGQGRVGIGTTDPQGTLNIVGTSATTNTGATVLVDDSAEVAVDIGGSIALRGTDGGSLRAFGLIRGGKETSVVNEFDGYLAFETRIHNQANTEERLRIASNGNVGIGTDSPDTTLTVENTKNWNFPLQTLRKKSSNNAQPAFLQFALDGDNGEINPPGEHAYIGLQLDSTPISGSTVNGLNAYMSFYAPKGVLIPTGNVGIGTDNPQSKLHVDGIGTFTGQLRGAGLRSNNIYLNENGVVTDGNDALRCYASDGTTLNVRIRPNGSATFAGNVNSANYSINLEPDNAANYTTTTDADGNETSVYNGPTLDVKERLLETVNFRTQMRETFQELQVAVEAATDFGELKAAMLVALEDYR
ncbi:MAG: hypothetical protein GY920_04250 [Aliivibrio sp.]|nr:hypothetical protein [Aliivibrio sp.]